MTDQIRKEPCSACPYRQDAPPGLWAAHEYEKLPEYDRPSRPLFGSGAEAAEHGLSAIEAPPTETVVVQERLLRKHERLRR